MVYNGLQPLTQMADLPKFEQPTWFKKRNGKNTTFGNIFNAAVPALTTIAGTLIGGPAGTAVGAAAGQAIVGGVNRIGADNAKFQGATDAQNQIDTDLSGDLGVAQLTSGLAGSIGLTPGKSGTPAAVTMPNTTGLQTVNPTAVTGALGGGILSMAGLTDAKNQLVNGFSQPTTTAATPGTPWQVRLKAPGGDTLPGLIGAGLQTFGQKRQTGNVFGSSYSRFAEGGLVSVYNHQNPNDPYFKAFHGPKAAPVPEGGFSRNYDELFNPVKRPKLATKMSAFNYLDWQEQAGLQQPTLSTAVIPTNPINQAILPIISTPSTVTPFDPYTAPNRMGGGTQTLPATYASPISTIAPPSAAQGQYELNADYLKRLRNPAYQNADPRLSPTRTYATGGPINPDKPKLTRAAPRDLLHDPAHTIDPAAKQTINGLFGGMAINQNQLNNVYALHQIAGNPEMSRDMSLSPGHNRAYYIPETTQPGTMHVKTADQYLAELPHAYQYANENLLPYGETIDSEINPSSANFRQQYDDQEYDRPKSIEYQAHREIQPDFMRTVIENRPVPFGTFARRPVGVKKPDDYMTPDMKQRYLARLYHGNLNGKVMDYPSYFAGGEVRPIVHTYNYGGMSGSVKQTSGYKLYSEGDKTEDLVMTDKKTGRKFGEMRYGEYILPQVKTLAAGDIMNQGVSDRMKKHALGSLLLEQLSQKPISGNAFAKGGLTEPDLGYPELDALEKAYQKHQKYATKQTAREFYNLYTKARTISENSGNNIDFPYKFQKYVRAAPQILKDNFGAQSPEYKEVSADPKTGKLSEVDMLKYENMGIEENLNQRTIRTGVTRTPVNDLLSPFNNFGAARKPAAAKPAAAASAPASSTAAMPAYPSSNPVPAAVQPAGTYTPPPSLRSTPAGTPGRSSNGRASGGGGRRNTGAPISTTAYTPYTGSHIYEVQAGDTLSGIAQKTTLTAPILAKYNGIADPNKIAVGQKIALTPNTVTDTVAAIPKNDIKPMSGTFNRTIPASASTQVGTAMPSTGNGPDSGYNWLSPGNVADAARAFVGYTQANRALPENPINPDYLNLVADARQRSENGLDPATKKLYKDQIDDNRSLGIEAVRRTMGGGGSAGAAIAGLNAINDSTTDAALKLAAADEQANQLNRNTYRGLLSGQIDMEQQRYGQAYNAGLINQQAGINLAQEGMAGIQGRYDTWNLYDRPGSAGQRFGQLQIDNADAATKAATANYKYVSNLLSRKTT